MKPSTAMSPVLSGTAIRANTSSAPCNATGHGANLADWLTPGSLLVYVRMLRLPENVLVDGRCYGYWRILDPTCASAVEQLVLGAAWQFFRMEPVIDVRALGKDESSALERALPKATRVVENENLNALEILDIECGKKLGLHTARIRACARHIQKATRYDFGGCCPAFKPGYEHLESKRRKVQ